jgi:hypothetical protein
VAAIVALAAFSLGALSVSRVVRYSLGEAAAAGAIGTITTVNKFGRNQDSDTTEDAIWEGSDLGGPIRCFDVIGTTAAALYLSSDDENDAAKEVTVEYLDASWDTQSVNVTLGAASAGGTVFAQIGSETILRINRMYATSTALVGNIYAGTDTADGDADGIPDTVLTELVAGIVIGENQTLQACYTVPNGYVALLTQFCTSNLNTAANATATTRLRKSVEGAASRVQEILALDETVYQCTEHDPPVMFDEKTDIELTNVSSANNASVTGTFDLILVPKTAL